MERSRRELSAQRHRDDSGTNRESTAQEPSEKALSLHLHKRKGGRFLTRTAGAGSRPVGQGELFDLLANAEDKNDGDPCYNIGDHCLMPAFNRIHPPCYKKIGENLVHDDRAWQRRVEHARRFQGSILNRHYHPGVPSNLRWPPDRRLATVTDEYTADNGLLAADYIGRDDILCVHVRSGDVGVCEDAQVTAIRGLLPRFRKVVILLGCHNIYDWWKNVEIKNGRSLSDQKAFVSSTFTDTIRRLVNLPSQICIDVGSSDEHISLMRQASNLLVHKGGFSVIGTLVCTGNLFITHRLHNELVPGLWEDTMKKRGKTYTVV